MRILAYILALITLGGLVPSRAVSQPYRLVCSYFEESRAAVYWIDSSGTVTLDQNLAVETDSYQVTVSSDGRAFVVAQDVFSISQLSPSEQPPWFFVQRDGTIARASCGPRPATPSVFAPDGETCYSGALPCTVVRLNYDTRCATATQSTAQQDVNVVDKNLGYSSVYPGVMWTGALQDFLQGVPVELNGDLGIPSDPFFFADKGSNRDMDVSPDGRFMAVLGLEDPQLAVIGILPDGTFYTVATYTYNRSGWNPYRVRYTPDGKHLLVLASTEPWLSSYDVDPLTGRLQLVDMLDVSDWLPGGGALVDALAITPDSRFAVVPNLDYPIISCTFLVYRIEDDGTLTRITQTRNDFPGWVSDMDFIPPYREPVTAAGTGWVLYQ